MRAGVAGRQERGQIQTQYLLMEKIKHERSAQNHTGSLATGLSRILGGEGKDNSRTRGSQAKALPSCCHTPAPGMPLNPTDGYQMVPPRPDIPLVSCPHPRRTGP